jgi:hypothetical protein
MNKTEDLLRQWEEIPEYEPSEAWQNTLMERAKTTRQDKAQATNGRTQFLMLFIGFVLFNMLFIAQIWIKGQNEHTSERQEGLATLSNQFFVKMHP